jgi:hypothetical protein
MSCSHRERRLTRPAALLVGVGLSGCAPDLVFTHTAALRGAFDTVEIGADPADLHHAGGGRVLRRALPDGAVGAVFQPGLAGVRLLAVDERGGAAAALVAARGAAFVWTGAGAEEPLADAAGGSGVRAAAVGGGRWVMLQAAPSCRLWWGRAGDAPVAQALPADACAAGRLALDAAGARAFLPTEAGLYVADGAALARVEAAPGTLVVHEPLTDTAVVGTPGAAEVVAWSAAEGAEAWRVVLPYPVVDLAVLSEPGLVVALLVDGDGAALALLDGATGDGLQSLDLPVVPVGVRASATAGAVVTWSADELHAFRVDATQVQR